MGILIINLSFDVTHTQKYFLISAQKKILTSLASIVINLLWFENCSTKIFCHSVDDKIKSVEKEFFHQSGWFMALLSSVRQFQDIKRCKTSKIVKLMKKSIILHSGNPLRSPNLYLVKDSHTISVAFSSFHQPARKMNYELKVATTRFNRLRVIVLMDLFSFRSFVLC
jgi:hypothetical protein